MRLALSTPVSLSPRYKGRGEGATISANALSRYAPVLRRPCLKGRGTSLQRPARRPGTPTGPGLAADGAGLARSPHTPARRPPGCRAPRCAGSTPLVSTGPLLAPEQTEYAPILVFDGGRVAGRGKQVLEQCVTEAAPDQHHLGVRARLRRRPGLQVNRGHGAGGERPEQVHQPGHIHIQAVGVADHVPLERERHEAAAGHQAVQLGRHGLHRQRGADRVPMRAARGIQPERGKRHARPSARRWCPPRGRHWPATSPARPAPARCGPPGMPGRYSRRAGCPDIARPWTASARIGTPCHGAPWRPGSGGSARPSRRRPGARWPGCGAQYSVA